MAGEQIFTTIDCAKCHTPTLTTGYSPIEVLSNRVFHPYTDLLLHDMGPGLDDGYTEGFALTSEWKTPPLWGLGLQKHIQGYQAFLHDGRARTLEEAILWHGGEAKPSQQAFIQLDKAQRDAVIFFLKQI